MLLRRHPPYPWRTYASDHQQLVDALRRRDPKTPNLVAEHLRLSARLLRGRSADTSEVDNELAD
jgi:DNA-binding FadR family transcriptional regulator